MAQAQSEIEENKKGVELDSNGVPYYKWPPFPDVPDGVSIVPFNDFKPCGIQIAFDEDVEVDGLGIPTVRLAVTHDNEAPPRKKKKTKKNSAGEEVRQRNIWWEEWEAGEAQRIRSANIYDQHARMFHPKARVARAVEEFKRVHDWQPVSLRLLEWYNKFMYFLGLNDISLRPRFHRNQEENQQPEEEDSDDDAASGAQQPVKPSPVRIEKFDEGKHKLRQAIVVEPDEHLQQRLARVREAQECRLEAFIDNPHLATKVFFSSYFRDSGMMWENMALRDAPRIVEFFLNYLLQTHALYEEEASLKLALEVARKAKEELPLTMKVGVNMPDELARCLTATYGSRLKKIVWPDEQELDAAEAQFKAQVEESGGEVISDVISEPLLDTVNGNTAEVDAIQLPQAEETTGGWSSIGIDAAGKWGGDSPTDDKNEAGDMEDNPWAQTKSNDIWARPDDHFLMALIGPTLLPVTHTVGYVEDSTRYVSSVMLPEPNSKVADKDQEVSTSSDLFRTFARVVLKPYPTFAAPSAPRAAIQPPELIEDPWAGIPSDGTDVGIEKPRIPRHDPEKDSITMLIDPGVAKDLASCKRMGLGGTFVQIVPDYAVSASVSSSAHGGGQDRGRGAQGRGHGGRHAGKTQTVDEDTFWYAEKILQIIPSFWTEKQT